MVATFTCNCCDRSLALSDEFCALGIKERLREMQRDGLHGEEFFHSAVSMLGLQNVMDPGLRQQLARSYRADPPASRAVLNLSENVVYFGNVSESEQGSVMKEFLLTNDGTQDLYIYQVGTSCSCLESKLVTDERESPSYGRFSFPYGMTVRIPAGADMRLRVTYDARVNSFFRGYETRYVYIMSNDLLMPTRQIDIHVNHVD
mgnify:CR=1 FL=1